MTVHLEIDLDDMRASASRTCGMLKTLANPDRLLLLCQISQGERCVGELEEALDIHQPTLSQQLGVLFVSAASNSAMAALGIHRMPSANEYE